MKNCSLLAFYLTCSITLISGLLTPDPLCAKSKPRDSWWDSTEAKIKTVYEQRRLRGKSFNGEWLSDSSGYVIRENNQNGKNERAIYDVTTGRRRENSDPALSLTTSPMLSPDGQHRLSRRGRNIWVETLKTGEKTLLMSIKDGRDAHFNSPKWSPDSKQILVIESDSTEIRLRPVLIPTDPSYPKVERHRFARVGEKIPKLRVGVTDLESRETFWLPIDSPQEGFYLGQVEWAGNSDEVLVEFLSRFRDRRTFSLINVSTESVQEIYSEVNDAWAVASQAKNLGLIWLHDGESFIVISEKDGWRHAFLHDRSGKQTSVLTPGDYDIIDRAAVDEEHGWFYFYASPENGTHKYLHRVPLDGSGKLERITPKDQPGTHDYVISPDCRWAFHTYSTINTPPVIDLVELPSHQLVRTLEPNKELHQLAKEWTTPPAEFLQITTQDDVTMDAWMIKPQDFDPAKKYPIFVYVYGEPHLQTVLDQWGAGQSHFLRVVADLGYIVVSIDNRGTPCPKGADWRRSIFGSLGPLSTEDQAAALQELGRMCEFIDLDRVGIWGWSGGGSNTLNAMFRKPDIYHVGIAVVPKPQPHLYNAWFQEIYMRTREVNSEGYEKAAPINFASGLKGDLLIMTGSGETNTHMQIIEGLVDRLIEMGKPFDYMVYPNRNHGLREGPGSEVHVRMLIIRYIMEHLTPGPM